MSRALAPTAGTAAAAILVVAVVAAYLPVVQAGFIWDDDAYVTANQTLRTTDGLRRIWVEPGAVPQYYPLTFTTFWIEYRLWSSGALGYHLVNVGLHALNAVLLWLVLRRLRLPGAWLAAAVFAVHPINVESVAWITERKNVLSAAFYLGAWLAYWRWEDRRRPDWYVIALALFVGALLSKSVTATLPAAIALVVWWQRGQLTARAVRPLVPFFALGLAASGMTVYMERHRVGAVGAEWEFSALERVLIAGRAVWFYAEKIVWPWRLTFVYPRWQIDAALWWQYLYPLAAVTVVSALLALRGRLGRGPLTAVFFFIGTLLPALGFFDVYPMRYSFVADHFAYLAMIGLVVLAAGVGANACARAGRTSMIVGQELAAGVLLTLGVLTWWQVHSYRDLETLWRDTLAKNPAAWMAHNNLGNVLFDQGKIDDALAHYRTAAALKGDYPEAQNNIGNALADLGRVGEAIGHYEEAIRIRPDYVAAYNNLGATLIQQGRAEEAVARYEEAIRRRPQFAEAHNNLGVLLSGQGRTDDAIARFEEALRYKPEYPAAHYNLATVLAAQGRTADAIAHYEEALRLQPDYPEAHNNLGVALFGQERIDAAAAHYREALRLAPTYAAAHHNLGLALMRAGQVDAAIQSYREAVRLDPQNAAAQQDLDAALRQAGADSVPQHD